MGNNSGRRGSLWPQKTLLNIALAIMLMNVSAYTSNPDENGGWSGGITASGVIATEGRTVAADHLPLGTVVRIDGIEYIVEDTFGGGYTDRLDIFMENEDAAWAFGRRWIEVEVLEEI